VLIHLDAIEVKL